MSSDQIELPRCDLSRPRGRGPPKVLVEPSEINAPSLAPMSTSAVTISTSPPPNSCVPYSSGNKAFLGTQGYTVSTQLATESVHYTP